MLNCYFVVALAFLFLVKQQAEASSPTSFRVEIIHYTLIVVFTTKSLLFRHFVVICPVFISAWLVHFFVSNRNSLELTYREFVQSTMVTVSLIAQLSVAVYFREMRLRKI